MDPKLFDVIHEGSASILFPKTQVFYNPVQQYNRDLSTLAIRAFANTKPVKRSHQSNPIPRLRILEALSATGLRAIRYANEIPQVETVVANDLIQPAVDAIKRNISNNPLSKDKIQPNLDNAITHMAKNRRSYDVVDLDPYGSVAPFIDSAMNAIKSGGLLLVTCTDLGVLAGNGYPEKCFSLYGGTNVWGDASHESALRLVLGLIGRTAAKYGMAIEPVLSLSIDFYVRVFVRVYEKPAQVKQFMSSNEVVVKCSGCFASMGQPLGRMGIPEGEKSRNKFGLAKIEEDVGAKCSHCGFVNHICGPMWGGNLHNEEFINEILKLVSQEEKKDSYNAIGKEIPTSMSYYGTLKRIRGMLTMAQNELGVNDESQIEQRQSQLYFSPTSISSVLKIPAPSIHDYCNALGNLGYKASLTHAAPNCIKTNAPWKIRWFIGIQLSKRANIDVEKMNKNAAGYKIMTNEKIINAVDLKSIFGDGDEKELIGKLFGKCPVGEKVDRLRKIKIVKFQENPTKNWGPKARPQSKVDEETK